MRWPAAPRHLGVYAALLGAALAVCVWQRIEHTRFERTATEALINRGRDITSTLGVVIRAQRRVGGVISKDRLQSTLQDLVRNGELEAIAILGATGETIASAGLPLSPTPELLRAPGLQWRDLSLTLMNLMDLGPTVPEGPPPVATIVVDDLRAFRQGATRRPTDAPATPPATKAGEAPTETAPRPPFGRPAWMSREDYESVIRKQGVHSLLIALSTRELRAAVRQDLLLRSLVSLLAVGAALGTALAWRNLRQASDLQLRLVRAGEMNAHLSEMNFAAAGLAHETRNPLNLIRGLAQLISVEPPASPRLPEHAARIVEEADRLTVQLNEFIHYSKPREAHPAPVDLATLAADVARTLQPDLEEKQVTLARPSAPLAILADAALLRQALFNLLLNAVQAVPPGGHVEVRWSSPDGRSATLEVADDGPGVPPAERQNIFKPYVTMRPQGVGLGLAIVHQIVAAHRWEITCTDHAPRGALFRLSHLQVAPARS